MFAHRFVPSNRFHQSLNFVTSPLRLPSSFCLKSFLGTTALEKPSRGVLSACFPLQHCSARTCATFEPFARRKSTLSIPTSEETAKSLISTGHLKEEDEKLFASMSDERALRFKQVLLRRSRKVTIVLDGVKGAHNVGAVARTCDAWGIQDVHFILSDSDSYGSISSSFQTDRTVQKVSKNSHRWLSMYEHACPEQAVHELKRQGYRICVSSLPLKNKGKVYDIFDDVESLQLDENKLAFVFGAEQDGVSEYCSNQADFYFTIPMVGFTESFNVSVAVGTAVAAIMPALRTETENSSESHPVGGMCSRYLSPIEAAQLAARWLRGLPPNSADSLENIADFDSVDSHAEKTAVHANMRHVVTSRRHRRFAKSLSQPQSEHIKSLENRFARGDVTRLGNAIEKRIHDRGLFVTENSHESKFELQSFRLHPDTGGALTKYFNKRKFGVMGDFNWKSRTDNTTYFISGSNALSCGIVTKAVYDRRTHLMPLFKSICRSVHAQFTPLFDQFAAPLLPSSNAGAFSNARCAELFNNATRPVAGIVLSILSEFGIDNVFDLTFKDSCTAFASSVLNGNSKSEQVERLAEWSAQCLYNHHTAISGLSEESKEIVDFILKQGGADTSGGGESRWVNTNVTIRAGHVAWVCCQIHFAAWDQHRFNTVENRLRSLQCNLLESSAVDAYAQIVMGCVDCGPDDEEKGRHVDKLAEVEVGVANAVLQWYRPLWMLQQDKGFV